jgi:hypothetical protein
LTPSAPLAADGVNGSRELGPFTPDGMAKHLPAGLFDLRVDDRHRRLRSRSSCAPSPFSQSGYGHTQVAGIEVVGCPGRQTWSMR